MGNLSRCCSKFKILYTESAKPGGRGGAMPPPPDVFAKQKEKKETKEKKNNFRSRNY